MDLCQTYFSPSYQLMNAELINAEPVNAEKAKPPLIVFIDCFFEELIPAYINRKRNDIETMLAALQKDDFSTIEVLADHMKGNGSSYGFDFISELGGQLELAASLHDHEQVLYLLYELFIYLERVQIVYLRR